MTLEWHTNVRSRKIPTVLSGRCCKNCYRNFSVLKADDKIKVRGRIFTFKTLIYVQHIMRVRFTLLCFLLILLVSTLFTVSNCFVSFFRLWKFTPRKNRLNAVYASDSIQPEGLPVSLDVVRRYF